MATSNHDVPESSQEKNPESVLNTASMLSRRTDELVEDESQDLDELKHLKARAKASFTRTRHQLLHLLDEEDLPSGKSVRAGRHKLLEAHERVMQIMEQLADEYLRQGDRVNRKKISLEMEKLETEFEEAQNRAQDHFDNRQNDSSSDKTSCISDIRQSKDDRHLKEAEEAVKHIDQKQFVEEELLHRINKLEDKVRQEQEHIKFRHEQQIHQSQKYFDFEKETKADVDYTTPLRQFVLPKDPYHPQMSTLMDHDPLGNQFRLKSAPTEIGKDLWKQLKRVSIPVFSGDKRSYENWKASFTACIDQAPATPEYKLLQLRQYLSGEALRVVERLGHSAAAYKAAKDRLDRKYGGTRRQVALYLEELENFSAIRQGNSKDLERFVDMLDVAVINLEEAGRNEELGNGSLYLKLQKKLTEQMLAQYHRWIFEKEKDESVLSLREWVIQESEFQTIASEAVQGISSMNERRPKPKNSPRTYFGRDRNVPRERYYTGRPSCILCNKEHGIWSCNKFKEMNTSERWDVAKRNRLCYRCLCDGHIGEKCTRSRICGVNGCRKTHNRLLHGSYNPEVRSTDDNQSKDIGTSSFNTERISKRISSATQTSPPTEGEIPEVERSLTTRVSPKTPQRKQFLAMRTVPVILKNGNRRVQVNALLDDASTSTYINADVAAELGVQGRFQKTKVNVLNGQVETFLTMPVEVGLESLDGNVNATISAFTTDKVTGDMCVINWNQYAAKWSHLAEIHFPNVAASPVVDLLIGIDNADLHYSEKDIRGQPGEPIARLTPLGWTCVGVPHEDQDLHQQTNYNRTYITRNDVTKLEEIDAVIRKFWEIESVASTKTQIWTMEDRKATEKVKQSLKFENGRYQVATPWKNDEPAVSNNYEMALSRLQNTEKRLKKNVELAGVYSDIIDQYIKKGYIRKVPDPEKRPTKAWYLPHFPVLRPDKPTTKTRIVFDASAKHNGISLNDEIHQGPKLQRELFNVLVRFRQHPVALICDIAEMYLRIEITPRDRVYHRFLWRSLDQNKTPDEYEFNRVVFGMNYSPFQAQFVVQQHAKAHESIYPMAADTVQESTYMDDSMDSVPTDAEGVELYHQLSELYRKADMHPHKWLSNSVKVLENIPVQERATDVQLDKSIHLPAVKTLGLQWLANEDVFTFTGQSFENDFQPTKRNFLKRIASVFDPMGFLAPFTIQAKIILQEMWACGLDWDETIEDNLVTKAQTWFDQLEKLNEIRVPRCFRLGQEEEVASFTLHTFVDASEDAYGAVVYAKHVYRSGKTSRRLIAAKTRVSPLKATSIPRLELMSAVLGLRLTISISNVLKVKPDQVTYWSDSMNVLWWIRSPSRQYQSFVANRIGEIQSSTNPNQWRHINSEENPADLLTRGVAVAKLVTLERWWHGPRFLEEDEIGWPKNRIEVQSKSDNEKKKTGHSLNYAKMKEKKINETEIMPERTMATVMTNGTTSWRLEPTLFSSWRRITRIQAWVNRFLNNCKSTPDGRRSGELTPDEITDAENEIIAQAQRNAFPLEVQALQNGKDLPKNSKLIGLRPKLDGDSLVRSDGRLQYAEFLSYDARFPIILPRKQWITKLLVKHYHEQGNHDSGTNHTLSDMSSRFWIMSGREEIRDWEKECAECKRRNAKAATQIMAPLPKIRLRGSMRAFTQTAVDLAGPFVTIQGRRKCRQKRYLCLFTCLACRAVHLEIAYSMDTDSFLNALYRMVSRRGLPEEIISDNGSNFVGAEKELRQLVQQLDQDRIMAWTANKGVKWHFNPPYAPHFGGVHETMIKSAKKAIHAILGNADITDEELMTAFTGAEALINSRPLTYQSANSKDCTPLTPNHFLHGQIGGKFAPETVDETDYSPKKRWRRIQELVRHFWHRWLREWLPTLNPRRKWLHLQRDIKEGDIVLVILPNSPRGHWPLGRIVKVHPGKDGHTRVVKVQVGKTVLLRPISKVCPLESER